MSEYIPTVVEGEACADCDEPATIKRLCRHAWYGFCDSHDPDRNPGTWVVFNGTSGYSDESMRFPTYDEAEFFMDARGEDSEDTYCVRYELGEQQ